MEDNSIYINAINPKKLYKNITPKELIIFWKSLEDITIENLLCAKEAFEKEEMYEHCEEISKYINELVDSIVLSDLI